MTSSKHKSFWCSNYQLSFFIRIPLYHIPQRELIKAVLQFSTFSVWDKKRITLEIHNKESLFRSLKLDDFPHIVIVGSPLIWSPNQKHLAYLEEIKRNFTYELCWKTQEYRQNRDISFDLNENTLNPLIMFFDKCSPQTQNSSNLKTKG